MQLVKPKTDYEQIVVKCFFFSSFCLRVFTYKGKTNHLMSAVSKGKVLIHRLCEIRSSSKDEAVFRLTILFKRLAAEGMIK